MYYFLICCCLFSCCSDAFIMVSSSSVLVQIFNNHRNNNQYSDANYRWRIIHSYPSLSSSSSSSHLLSLAHTKTNNNNDNDNNKSRNTNNDHQEYKGIRLNKVFKATHSRREADKLVSNGRVTVNGKQIDTEHGGLGYRVIPFVDIIALDGKVIKNWEAMNGIMKERKDNSNKKNQKSDQLHTSTTTKTTTIHDNFEYIKYWKPKGIICTTDQSIKSNIIDDLLYKRNYKPKHRVYPIGRLDKDTSGLILLTSNGALPNSVLRGQYKQSKIYQVIADKSISDKDIQQLRKGVVITTIAQRTNYGNNNKKALTAPTLPCQVHRIAGTKRCGVTMTLIEGRNRQIRKMMSALGYEVIHLHRIEFMGIPLDPLQQPGEWKILNEYEMQLVDNVLKKNKKQSPPKMVTPTSSGQQ